MPAQLRMALLGEGPQAASWAEHLEKLDITVEREPCDGVDAFILAPGVRDPFALATQALRSRRPVLYATPMHLGAGQAAFLARLSARQGCLLRFAESFRHRPGFAFLERVLAGSEPLWQLLYLRSLRLAEPSSRIDELAIEELAMCLALLGEPDSVTAASSLRDGAETCAIFLTLQYGSALAQCTISLAEGTDARQLVAATAGRTIVLDDLAPMAAVRILDGQHVGEGPVSRGAKLVVAESPDVIAAETKLFVTQVAAGDRSGSNAGRWASVAGLWQAARQSLRLGVGQTEPPPLIVIEGGGGGAVAGRSARPALTLVS